MIDVASTNPAFIDATLDARACTFENPTGGRGAGGSVHDGRKGAPNRLVGPGERVVLADIAGPGMIRHIWLTYLPAPPEVMRAFTVEVFYDGASEPSVSVPCLDFFGLPHGRPAAFSSALLAAQEGRGFNCYLPMPFAESVRVELTNRSTRPTLLYYQIDYTLHDELPTGVGYLHATFRRQNPTTMREDFVIVDGLKGPGRFIGCNLGVRILDEGNWWGEGEVKFYRDGDRELPTICGTGLEDYVGTAWGMFRHHAPHGGAPLVSGRDNQRSSLAPDFVSFYRWHLLDPIMFSTDLRATIQQIGAANFGPGQEQEFEAYAATHPAAGGGWLRDLPGGPIAWGIVERVDDYCATAYVYCAEPQPVPTVDIDAACADIARLDYETPSPFEAIGALLGGPT